MVGKSKVGVQADGLLVSSERFLGALEGTEGIALFEPLLSSLLKCSDECCHIRMTRFSLFCQRCEDGLLDRDRQLRIELSWRNGLFMYMFKRHVHYSITSEGWPSGKEFVSNAAQSVLIAFLTGGAIKLLWCYILHSMGGRAGAKGDFLPTDHAQRPAHADTEALAPPG